MRKEKQNQACIDAATAEVKKEEKEKDSGFADNTDAVHSNSREQTGLLPCPFCGGTKQRMQDWSYDDDWFAVQCQGPNCGCSVGSSSNFQHAVERWNTRAAPQSTLPQAPTDTSKEKENATCLAARVEPTKKWEVHKTNQPEPYNWDIYCGDGHSVIKGFLTEQQAKSLTAAHNASCAVKEEEEKDLGLR